MQIQQVQIHNQEIALEALLISFKPMPINPEIP